MNEEMRLEDILSVEELEGCRINSAIKMINANICFMATQGHTHTFCKADGLLKKEQLDKIIIGYAKKGFKVEYRDGEEQPLDKNGKPKKQKPLDDPIEDNYRYCNRYLIDWSDVADNDSYWLK